MCVNTARDSWPSHVAGDGIEAKLLAAHEYAHVWQAEQGCDFDEDKHTHQWLFEGVATYLSWQALLHEGRAKRAALAENVRYTAPSVATSPRCARTSARAAATACTRGGTSRCARWRAAPRARMARSCASAAPSLAAHRGAGPSPSPSVWASSPSTQRSSARGDRGPVWPYA